MAIDGHFKSDAEFIEEIKHELLTEHVYVYKHTGEIIELPQGSTALDFACQVYSDKLDQITGILVNGKDVPVHTVLKNNDRVQITTKGLIDRTSWENCVKTLYGKNKIYSLCKEKTIK